MDENLIIFFFCLGTGDGKMVKKDGDFKMEVEDSKAAVPAAGKK